MIALLRRALARLAGALLLVVAAWTLTFLLLQAAPGDAVDHLVRPEMGPEARERLLAVWGLDRPLGERLLAGLAGLLRGDLGVSITWHEPVTRVVARALPSTLALTGTTLAFLVATGVATGVLQATRRGGILDHGLGALGLLAASVPGFWLATVLVLVFSLHLGWLPATGAADPAAPPLSAATAGTWLLDRLRHLVLPAMALGVARSAGVARVVRASLVEALAEPWAMAARARGLPRGRVVRAALRLALPPVIALLGMALPVLLGGSVVIETVFAWDGVGRLLVGAIFRQDTPLVLGVVAMYAAATVAGNLLADAAIALCDPRVRPR